MPGARTRRRPRRLASRTRACPTSRSAVFVTTTTLLRHGARRIPPEPPGFGWDELRQPEARLKNRESRIKSEVRLGPDCTPRPMADPAPAAKQTPAPYDRSLIEGPIGPAVWKLAWPTMLQNAVAG